MEAERPLIRINVGVELFCIRFWKWGFLQSGVDIEVAKAYKVVESNCREHKDNNEWPEIKLKWL